MNKEKLKSVGLILSALMISFVLVYISTLYEGTHQLYHSQQGIWETYRAWGFPFLFALDVPVGSPIGAWTLDDKISFLPLIANVLIYFVPTYLLMKRVIRIKSN